MVKKLKATGHVIVQDQESGKVVKFVSKDFIEDMYDKKYLPDGDILKEWLMTAQRSGADLVIGAVVQKLGQMTETLEAIVLSGEAVILEDTIQFA